MCKPNRTDTQGRMKREEKVTASRLAWGERAHLGQALKDAEAALQTRDTLLAIVAHELRNPLHTLGLTASRLEFPLPEAERANQLAVIQRAIVHMGRLLDDLLDASALESGRLRLEKAPLRLPLLLREVCESFQNEAAQKSLALSCALLDDCPPILADRGRLIQALANLMGNAIKFTPPGGRVGVSARCSEAEAILSVEDTGPGIPAAERPHLFERFWHTHRALHSGVGLGLAITKGLIEAHGGRIWVESHRGTGTRIAFSLPFSGGAALQGQPIHPAPPSGTDPAGRPRVLTIPRARQAKNAG